MEKPTITVWFSCGAASAVAAKETLRLYGDTHTIRVVNNPIKEEDPDNRRFLEDVEQWLGVKIEEATHTDYPDCSAVSVWEKRQFMSGPTGAPCTMILKKEARQQWEKENHSDSLVLGFTADEEKRAEMFQKTERSSLIPVLVHEGITKQDCFDILTAAGLQLPRVYSQGYPNANCIGCVKATSPTYWNHVRKMHPEVFDERASQSRAIGARLVRVKGKRIFLDELDPKAKGNSLASYTIECGIFCEEHDNKVTEEDCF